MAVYRRSARSRLAVVILVLTSATLITLDQRSQTAGALRAVRDAGRDAFAPVQDATSATLQPVGNFFEGMVRYGDLRAENARLREENAQLRAASQEAADAARVRKDLLEQQNLPYAGTIPRVTAEVVDSSASNFQLTVEINKGTSSGVDRNMPVVTGAGLVGKVIDASRSRATVLLLTDPSFNVGLRVTDSGDLGVAHGQGEGHSLAVDFVLPDVKVQKAGVLVTSGLQHAAFPSGVPVGKVVVAAKAPGGLTQDVELQPVADLGRLDFVTVLQWAPQP